jgi:tripartite-type tricarboxylate transporter receptor subunit TctC
MNKRIFLQYIATLASSATVLSASAQDAPYPVKPIRIIAGSAPGALLDAASRAYAERMSAYLKQPILVENMAGASSILAARYVAKASADGYTLLAGANTIVTTPHLNKKAGYDWAKDFTAIGEMTRSPALLVTSSASPIKSLAQLVAAAKQNGRAIAYASGGQGTTSHLPVELFARQAGITFTHIPYKGNAVAVPDVVSGRVTFMMGAANSFAGLLKSGALRALAISSDARSPAFPDVPTFKELGYPGATYDIWVGLLAPAAMPKAIRARLADAMEAARGDQGLRQRLQGLGQEISSVRTPDQFEAFLHQEEDKYRKLIVEAKIVAE